MSKKILVVDDSVVSRMMIKAIIIESLPSAEIIEAGNGEQALEIVNSDSCFDIAFIDYNMPGMTGVELIYKLEEIIKIPRRALLTANIQNDVKNKAIEAGVTFLNKPITEELISTFLMEK